MKKTIGVHEFIEAFSEMGRGDQFSISALYALFEYFENLEADLGEERELDVIGICCDWTEYTLEEVQSELAGFADCKNLADAEERLLQRGDVSDVVRVPGDPETLLVWW